MKKELVREINFGKAIARVTVESFTDAKLWDGIDMGTVEVTTIEKIEIVVNGKVVATENGSSVSVMRYNSNTDTYFDRAGFDPKEVYTVIGRAAFTKGEKTGNEIIAAIKEMKEELATEFGVKTPEKMKEEKKVKVEQSKAQEIVRLATKQGIENLKTDKEVKIYKENYKMVVNEGGEGFVPELISVEQYQRALKALQNHSTN